MDLSKSAEGPKTDSRPRSRAIVLWSRTARGGPAGPWKLLNNSRLLRALFKPLRSFMPILTFRRRGFVFRHADVRELLSRDEDFTIAEINAPSMDRVNG